MCTLFYEWRYGIISSIPGWKLNLMFSDQRAISRVFKMDKDIFFWFPSLLCTEVNSQDAFFLFYHCKGWLACKTDMSSFSVGWFKNFIKNNRRCLLSKYNDKTELLQHTFSETYVVWRFILIYKMRRKKKRFRFENETNLFKRIC